MQTTMAKRLPSVISNARKIIRSHSLHAKNQKGVPKGHVAVYVGECEVKRYLVPLTYLSHPSFKELLRDAEEKFDYSHPMGGLTIPYDEEAFTLSYEEQKNESSSGILAGELHEESEIYAELLGTKTDLWTYNVFPSF